ncbi:MAG TPA: hypothetical protein VF363_06480 [Candidatus Eisenbacteria bacterium]
MKAARSLGILIAFGAALGLSTVSCNGGKNPTSPGGGGTTADVVIHVVSGAFNRGAGAYSPDTATVAVGQTVQWVNDDGMAHTATGTGFNASIPASGVSAPVTITGGAGIRAYHCAVVGHTMTGALNVTP